MNATGKTKAWRVVRAVVGGVLVAIVGLYIVASMATANSQFARAVVWRDADTDDYKRFPAREIRTAAPTVNFARTGADDPIARWLRSSSHQRGAERVPLDKLLADSGTTAFLVVKDDGLVYERYFNGSGRDGRQERNGPIRFGRGWCPYQVMRGHKGGRP